MAARHAQLDALVRPVVEGLGFELWGIEFLSQGKHSVLRIYIDHEEGVDVEGCATVSRQISALLDVEDPISAAYTLEVSSPGMDRPLFELDQFARFAGYRVQIRLRAPFEGRRNFSGLLKGVEAEDVVVEVDDHEYLLPVEEIEKAHIVPQF